MTKKQTIVSALMLVVLFVAGNTVCFAESEWAEHHPRRHQVNQRLRNQNLRIHNDVKNGTLTKDQAAQLHREHRQIRQEERLMASQHGGHITRQEQRTLNQQENAISKQIP